MCGRVILLVNLTNIEDNRTKISVPLHNRCRSLMQIGIFESNEKQTREE